MRQQSERVGGESHYCADLCRAGKPESDHACFGDFGSADFSRGFILDASDLNARYPTFDIQFRHQNWFLSSEYSA